MRKPKKNFELDEMGQVSSEINPLDQIVSPDNSSGVKIPGYDIGIPMQPGMGVRINNYESHMTGSYVPGKQWKTKN